uniref:Uncharacterized protein n=1 Tax=Vespula pensylvanica TaxID=30213 RepID=A0A834K134_VESPE|nr:hypothetical protein H0235_016189 [Vespula pensylvanica]
MGSSIGVLPIAEDEARFGLLLALRGEERIGEERIMKTKEPWTLNDRNMGLPTSVGHSFANVDAFIALFVFNRPSMLLFSSLLFSSLLFSSLLFSILLYSSLQFSSLWLCTTTSPYGYELGTGVGYGDMRMVRDRSKGRGMEEEMGASVCGASSTKAQRLPLLPIPLVYYSEQGQGRSKRHRGQNTDSILGSSTLDLTP